MKYFTDRSKAVFLLWIFYVFVLSCVCYVLCASVYMCFADTCWERADLLALVCGVFCEFVTFPLVSWVRCGTWLYRFLIFATLLTLLPFSNMKIKTVLHPYHKKHASLSSKVTAAWHSLIRYKYKIWTAKCRHCDNGWHNPDQCMILEKSPEQQNAWLLCHWGDCTSYWVVCLKILQIWCCIWYISPRQFEKWDMAEKRNS